MDRARNQSEFSRDLELRHLPAEYNLRLAQILDNDESVLSLLMGNIVRDLENPESELKFTSAEIDSIRAYARQHNRSAIIVLLDEWSTMGRVRPKLRHLLELLTKCQLFRAAEYVASLIGEAVPKRPADGPAAKVDLTLPGEAPEAYIDGIEYPFSNIAANQDKFNIKAPAYEPNINSIIYNNATQPALSPPTSLSPFATSSSKIFQQPISLHNGSDMIKFSSNSVERNSVVASSLNGGSSLLNIPAFSAIQRHSATVKTDIPIPESSRELPALSGLMLNRQPPSEQIENDINLLPTAVESMNLTNHAAESAAAINIPILSALIGGKKSQNISNYSTYSEISESVSNAL